MNKNINLQDVFLNQARKERIGVTIFLTNGFQFKGVVKGFDSYVVILECDGKQNLSTSTPFQRSFRFTPSRFWKWEKSNRNLTAAEKSFFER